MIVKRLFGGGYILLFAICTLLGPTAYAQFYFGLSPNIGHRMTYAPSSKGFNRPLTFSGNALLALRIPVRGNWEMLYSVSAGYIGYTVKVHAIDTLRPDLQGRATFIFPDVSTFSSDLSAVLGRSLFFSKKKLLFGIGGGLNYSYSRSPSEYGISTHFPDGSEKLLFHATSSPINKPIVFGKLIAHCTINKILIIGVEYIKYFSPILNGQYEFYDAASPSKGSIRLYPNNFSIIGMIKLKDIHQRPKN